MQLQQRDTVICCIITLDNKTIVRSKLRSQSTTHEVHMLIFIAEQNLVAISAVVSAIMLLSLYRNTQDAPYRTHFVKAGRHPQNGKYITLPSEEDRATATGNMHKIG